MYNSKEDLKFVLEEAKKRGLNLQFAAYRGSIAHGCYVEGVSDDIDIIGCFTYDPMHYLGVTPQGNDTIEIVVDEYDILLYEVKKFLRLLAAGNPNVISSLWVDGEHILYQTHWAEALVRSRKQFDSKVYFKTFIGYAQSQWDKMTRTTGNIGEARRKLIEKAGYNTKHAHHCLRLLNMLMDYIVLGDMFVNRQRIGDADFLIAVKNGEVSLEDVEYHFNMKLESLRLMEPITSLPDEPDWQLINWLSMEAIIDDIVSMKLD